MHSSHSCGDAYRSKFCWVMGNSECLCSLPQEQVNFISEQGFECGLPHPSILTTSLVWIGTSRLSVLFGLMYFILITCLFSWFSPEPTFCGTLIVQTWIAAH